MAEEFLAVAQNNGRRGGSAIDPRATRHAGYGISQQKRKRIEECFGWLKTIALLRKVRHRGIFKVDWVFTFACAVGSRSGDQQDAPLPRLHTGAPALHHCSEANPPMLKFPFDEAMSP
jgi:hypothetical protein